jgi:transposase
VPEADRRELQRRVRDKAAPARVVERARIVLLAADEVPGKEIAAIVGCAEGTVVTWRGRYAEHGLPGLEDLPRPGKPAQLPEALRDRVLELTLTEPPDRFGATHWSSRLLAPALAGEGTPISHATVARIWHRFGVQPWRTATFKFSTDPQLEAKIRDVVGLYLHPPEQAVVVCVDEKPQIQALQRTAPTLPVRPGHPAAASFDYVGTAPPRCSPRWRWPPDASPRRAPSAIVTRSSWPSSNRSPPPIRAASCTWWSTTCPPTHTRWCAPGWSGIRGCGCTSRRPRGRG